MSINYFEKQNILFGREVSTPENSPAFVTGSTSNKNNVANVPIVSQETVEADGIGDSFKPTSKPQNTHKSPKEVKVCDVEKEILKQLAGLNAKYNLGLTEENCLDFLAFSYLSSSQQMHNATMDEIKAVVKHIDSTINAMNEDGIEVTMENLRAESRKYKGLINAGWDSVESFRKSVKNGNSHSLTERMQAMGISDFTKLSDEEKLSAIKRYFNDLKRKGIWKARKNDLQNWEFRSPEEKAVAVEKYILSDFAKLVALSTPKERELLYNTIKDLKIDLYNKSIAVESVFSAYATIEECQEFADKNCTVTAMHEMIKDAKVEETEAAIRIVQIQTQHQSEEVFVRNAQEQAEKAIIFFKENEESLKVINQKVKNGVRLTAEEKALYSEAFAYETARPGMYRGFFTSQTMKNTAVQVNVLEALNVGTMQIAQHAGEAFYRNVLCQTADFIQNHSNELTMSVNQANAMMDATTRGNYSTVVSDRQNGTISALNTHTEVDSEMANKIYAVLEHYDGKYTSATVKEIVDSNVKTNVSNNEQQIEVASVSNTEAKATKSAVENKESTKGSLGFATKPDETALTITSLNAKIQNLAKTSKEVETNAPEEERKVKNTVISEVAIAVRENGIDGLKSYVKENGTKKTILEILNDGENILSYVKDIAITWYKKFNNQIDILSRASIDAIKELLPFTNEEVLLNNKGKTFTNYYATKLFNDKAKEVEKESRKRNYAC